MLLTALLASLTISQPPAQKPWEFKDGDRIVWIGNTLVEREQRYGYWETALLISNRNKKITFRNLGWSGDTVYGDARAGFDNAAKGFERLVSLTLELKPTVIYVSYGTNEAFEGKEGLKKFETGMEKLLDALKPANARIVLFSPLPFHAHPRLPDPKPMNEILALYGDSIRVIGEKRHLEFQDLFHLCPNLSPEQTENGMHLNGEGYKLTSGAVLFRTSPGDSLINLADNKDSEKLREAVVQKNRLFFYRWRPQNETYLFGFRKHEQGKNAKEVAEFDPLVSKAEDEIQKILKDSSK